jgi:flavin reductase (DIM6/NTAB) family NADH-FMN oxidoreductase RutF
VNAAAISSLLSQLDRELWLVTARTAARQGGLIATFVNSASIVPELPRVLVGVARQHYTWELIEASGAFALHLLAEEHLPWVWRFGMRSGRDGDKLAGLATRSGESGAPLLTEALAWLDCRVEARMSTGDRTVYLAEVLDGHQPGSQPVLTVRRMLQVASPDKLQELKTQLAADAAVDAAAIREWRGRSGTSTD